MQKQYTFIGAIFFLVLLFPALLPAGEIVFYDADESQLPAEQPWLSYSSLGVATQQSVDNGVRLGTETLSQAGYSNYTATPQTLKKSDFPALNREKGVELNFQLQVHSESHVSADRAGVSVILLADDKKGVEIGFWKDEIWAQADTPDLFTHGESTAFDTTGGLVNYTIVLQGNSYMLYQNGTRILTGNVKDYSAFTGNPNPYILSNFLFFGDNTSSGQADVTLGRVTMKTGFCWPLFLPAMRGVLPAIN